MEKKKMLSCLAIGGIALFTVGCGTDQLQEKKVYGEGYEILKCDIPSEETEDTEAQATYLQIVKETKSGKIVETSLNLEFDYTDTLKDDKTGVAKKTMHSGLNLMCDAFEKQGYFDCYYSADKYVYTLTMGMDSKELVDDSDINLTDGANLEDVKAALEAQKELEVTNCRIEK